MSLEAISHSIWFQFVLTNNSNIFFWTADIQILFVLILVKPEGGVNWQVSESTKNICSFVALIIEPQDVLSLYSANLRETKI